MYRIVHVNTYAYEDVNTYMWVQWCLSIQEIASQVAIEKKHSNIYEETRTAMWDGK